MKALRVTPATAAWVGAYLVCLALLVLLLGPDPWWNPVVVSLGVIPLEILWWLTLVDRRRRRRRTQVFAEVHGGSLAAVRDSLDGAALQEMRQLRDSQGEIHAVRRLRSLVPELTLAQAAELVRGL